MTANSAIFEPRWPLGPARSARKDRRGVLRLAGDCQKREAGADFRSGRSPSGECRIYGARIAASYAIDYNVDPWRAASSYPAIRIYWPDLPAGAPGPGLARTAELQVRPPA